MLIALPILAFLLTTGVFWWRERRGRSRPMRSDQAQHRLYLRSRRLQWLNRWLYGSRQRQLTYRPIAAPERAADPD